MSAGARNEPAPAEMEVLRHDHPHGAFRFAQIPIATAWAGDVYARALVRRVEIQRSLEFVREEVASLPRGAPRERCHALRPGELVVALEEGWRAEIVHVVVPMARVASGDTSDRPVVSQLGCARAGDAGESDLGLPALQQELQPLISRS